MLDVFGIPTTQTSNYQEFFATGDWIKPRGASMVRILLVGAGGGGGSGGGSANGCGGGGGGSLTNWLGPALFVPDQLRAVVGVGGASNSNGGASSVVYQRFGVDPVSGTGYTLLSANGGTGGTTAVTAGAGGVAFTGSPFAATGLWNSLVGTNGGVGGGPSDNGGLVTGLSTTAPFLGGGGGAGAAAGTGGQVGFDAALVLAGLYPTLPSTTAGGTIPGRNGRSIFRPNLLGFGGTGGTTNGSNTGTAGGRGGIGSGGGGAGRFGALGIGGRGGGGMVAIWTW
jgi:hypothetical protein